jgi:hypothetical protein
LKSMGCLLIEQLKKRAKAAQDEGTRGYPHPGMPFATQTRRSFPKIPQSQKACQDAGNL